MEHINASRHKQTNCLAISCPEGGLFPPAYIHHRETVSTAASCLSQRVCRESRKCCSFPLRQLILSVQIITVCVCMCVSSSLKLKHMDFRNGKFRTGGFFFITKTTSPVLLFGILVHKKFPLHSLCISADNH